MFNIRKALFRNKGLVKNLRKAFSSNNGPDLGSMARTANLALLGLGGAGLLYMFSKSRPVRQSEILDSPSTTHRTSYPSYTQQKVNYVSPVVQSRVQSAMAYFGGGLTLTGLSISLFRYSSLAYANPLLLFIPTIGALLGTMFLSYHTQSTAKHLCWGAFCGLEGLAMAPLINMAGMPIVFNALAATGAMMGLLGAYAYNLFKL